MSVLKSIILVVYLIAAIAIIGIVLTQEGKSAGLGTITGSSSSSDSSHWGKIKSRSLEGKLERWTKVAAGVFIGAAILLMLF